jgi:large subunit ribosomal protein L4e
LTRFRSTRRITSRCYAYLLGSFLTGVSSLPTAKIANPDVTRLINSDEIQSVVRPAGQKVQKRPWTQKKNPLVNKAILFRLNPYAKTLRRQEIRTSFSFFLPHRYQLCTLNTVKQERLKKKDAKKPKQPNSANKAFLDNLFAP